MRGCSLQHDLCLSRQAHQLSCPRWAGTPMSPSFKPSAGALPQRLPVTAWQTPFHALRTHSMAPCTEDSLVCRLGPLTPQLKAGAPGAGQAIGQQPGRGCCFRPAHVLPGRRHKGCHPVQAAHKLQMPCLRSHGRPGRGTLRPCAHTAGQPTPLGVRHPHSKPVGSTQDHTQGLVSCRATSLGCARRAAMTCRTISLGCARRAAINCRATSTGCARRAAINCQARSQGCTEL